MYNSVTFEVGIKDSLYSYFEEICNKYKCMYNTANFYIRNTMTGIKKSPEKREANETEVLHYVFTGITKLNSIRNKTLRKKIDKVINDKNLSEEEKTSRIEALLSKDTKASYPSIDKWFLNYNTLEGILKLSENEAYNNLPSQVNQQAIKDCITSWDSFFKSLADYKANPSKYTDKPKLPKYKRSDLTTSTFTNIVCKLKTINGKTYLRFPKTKNMLCLGTYIKEDEHLVLVKVVPFNGKFKVILTLGEKETITKEELALLKEEKIKNAKRIFSIDLGINNFATISNNIEVSPTIIKGEFIKSKNQYFNKRRALLTSKVQKGKDSTCSIKHTKRLNSLSRKRSNFFKDFFYKASHLIIREAIKNNIDTIVIGHTKFWKQEANIGSTNNQNFVNIPYDKFISILTYIASKNNIFVVDIEESYTSKASFLDMDDIPTYKENENKEYTFSGSRIRRGMYKSKEGILINADINGASNILRKMFSNAFNEIKDLSYVYNKVIIYNFNDFYSNRSNCCA